jgi:hypothetical protein
LIAMALRGSSVIVQFLSNIQERILLDKRGH